MGYTPIDATGAPAGAETLLTENFSAKDNTPQRFSRARPVPSGRYACARSA